MSRVVPHPDKEGFLLIHGREYATVAARIAAFRKDFPISKGYAIRCETLEYDEFVHVRAEIVHPEGFVVAVGDKRQKNGLHKLESCQTGAVGRALAFAGYASAESAGAEVASADDMLEFLESEEQPPAFVVPKPSERARKHAAAVWGEHTSAEVEAFLKATEALQMTPAQHALVTSSLGRSAPWEMEAGARMRYAEWLKSEKGQEHLKQVLA
jgi:hypothetical protein